MNFTTKEDFEKLNDYQKNCDLLNQNLSWFERKDFEKLDNFLKERALNYQNLSWFERKDFEKLDNSLKECALINQNLSWFERKDFEKLNDYQKNIALINQNLSWFTKKILGVYYKIHKKRTKKQCLKEMKDYAKRHNLTFNGEYLFAFREHDKYSRGKFSKTIFYEKGKYYKDWHLNADEIEQNSFGLGIFPEGNTPVKVHVDDWGCQIKESNKCRVWAFTIL